MKNLIICGIVALTMVFATGLKAQNNQPAQGQQSKIDKERLQDGGTMEEAMKRKSSDESNEDGGSALIIIGALALLGGGVVFLLKRRSANR